MAKSTTKATKAPATKKTAAKAATAAKSKPSPQKKKVAQKGPAANEDIAARAFQIWEAEGCPEGRDIDHWTRAEQELNDK